MNNKGLTLNNNGFTLVELLAVITILLAFSIVAVTNVSASLKRNDEQKYEAQKEMAINAAKIYFSLENKTCVTRDTLVDYINDLEIDKLDNSFSIKRGTDNYIYTKNGTC